MTSQAVAVQRQNRGAIVAEDNLLVAYLAESLDA